MTYTGRIKNGVAVLDHPIDLPDGTPVRIEVDRSQADFWRGKSLDELAQRMLPVDFPTLRPCASA